MKFGTPDAHFQGSRFATWESSGEGSPTKIDYREKGVLILTFLLEDLVAETKLTPLPYQELTDSCFEVSQPHVAWGKSEDSGPGAGERTFLS